MTQPLDRMRKLVEELNAHSHRYYTEDSPTISDKEYDGLTLNLTYSGGELTQASTRGTGELSVKCELYRGSQGKLTKILNMPYNN
jgi:NAD-dependent DNA ligase